MSAKKSRDYTATNKTNKLKTSICAQKFSCNTSVPAAPFDSQKDYSWGCRSVQRNSQLSQLAGGKRGKEIKSTHFLTRAVLLEVEEVLPPSIFPYSTPSTHVTISSYGFHILQYDLTGWLQKEREEGKCHGGDN